MVLSSRNARQRVSGTQSSRNDAPPRVPALGLRPLLDLELRLGEGTGAALALPLVRAAHALLTEMATFDQAGVADAGR